jgi:hypothetical protein
MEERRLWLRTHMAFAIQETEKAMKEIIIERLSIP